MSFSHLPPCLTRAFRALAHWLQKRFSSATCGFASTTDAGSRAGMGAMSTSPAPRRVTAVVLRVVVRRKDHVLLDPRTIFPDQLDTVARAVRAALDG